MPENAITQLIKEEMDNLKLHTFIVLGFTIFYGIMRFWSILFDIYTKQVEPNNKRVI